MNLHESRLLFNWGYLIGLKKNLAIFFFNNFSDFSNSQFLEKMQKLNHKLPKRFANCKLQTANLNPDGFPIYK